MARRTNYTVAFDSPAEEIHHGFTSREYWESLVGAHGNAVTQSEVAHYSSDPRGTDITITHGLPRTSLPPMARAVLPVDVLVTLVQHFGAHDRAKNRANGTFSVSIPAVPGHVAGDYFLTETDTGSQVRVESVCTVRIPLVGGQLERLFLHQVSLAFESIAAFMADWISQHH